MATREKLERAKNYVILDLGSYISSNIFLVEEMVVKLLDYVEMFKIGLNLLTIEGSPKAINAVKRNHGKIFYHGNFNDESMKVIKQSVESIVKERVTMFTVNMSSSVKQIVESKEGSKVCIVLPPSGDFVLIAKQALALGCEAVLCSPQQLKEIGLILVLLPLKKIVYGICPAFIQGENSKEMTPKEAINFGADYMIFNYEDFTKSFSEGMLPEEVAMHILEEIADVF